MDKPSNRLLQHPAGCQHQSNMYLRLISCVILAGAGVFGFCSLGAFSQNQNSQATIRAEVALVDVVLTSVDGSGRPVQGLKAEDFQIFEDKVPQKIEYFTSLGKASEVPLTIALLIDTSGSVKNELDYEKATAIEFLKEVLRPNKDLALIIQFDSDVNLVQDFTQRQEDLLKALESLKAGNSTALYDAVYLAAEEKLKGEVGRKVMVIITDGNDTSSKVKEKEAIETAQRNNAMIYGIGVQSERVDFGVLKKFAGDTGGAFFSPRARFEEIQSAFRAIGEDILGQYSIAYSSTNRKKDGSFRSIDIRCKVSGVRIRARKGYYAPKSSGQ
jgi:VWFA-related protein